jgi:hypothetical protein
MSSVVTIRGAVLTFLLSALTAGLLTVPAAVAAQPYDSCDEARAADRANIPRGDDAYDPSLDADDDGVACEVARSGRPIDEDLPNDTARNPDQSGRARRPADRGVEAPAEIDAGGGYCATHDCG